MARDTITVTSTTDTPEQVDAVLTKEGVDESTKKTHALTEETGDNDDKDEKAGAAAATEEDEVAEGDADEGDEVEDDADDEDEEGADDTPAAPESDDKTDKSKPRRRRGGSRRSMRDRIDTLTYRLNREQEERAREREEYDRRIKSLEKPAESEKEPTFDKAKPSIDDFETLEEWQNAVLDWSAERAEFVADQKINKRLGNVVTNEQQQRREVERSFEGRLTSYRETNPEFVSAAEQAKQDQLPVTPIMMEHFIQSGDMGPKLMHYLALDATECRRIAALPSALQLTALGRLEARIESGALDKLRKGKNGKPSAGAQVDEEEQPPAVPKAAKTERRNQTPPEPPNPVRGRGQMTETNPDKMSYQEHKQWRRDQLHRTGRR